MRQFAGIVMAGDQVPDETTILNFRRLLERHDLTRVLFEGVKNYLDEHGFYLKQGTIVDASMIAAPSSTKNRDKKRDADMSSTKKNNQWYYGMKAHIGVDTDSRLVHSGEATTAKVQDSQKLDGLLHGEERDVHGDKAYAGAERQLLNSNPDERIWGMPFKKPKGGELKDWEKGINRRLSGLARQGRTSLSRHQVPARVP